MTEEVHEVYVAKQVPKNPKELWNALKTRPASVTIKGNIFTGLAEEFTGEMAEEGILVRLGNKKISVLRRGPTGKFRMRPKDQKQKEVQQKAQPAATITQVGEAFYEELARRQQESDCKHTITEDTTYEDLLDQGATCRRGGVCNVWLWAIDKLKKQLSESELAVVSARRNRSDEPPITPSQTSTSLKPCTACGRALGVAAPYMMDKRLYHYDCKDAVKAVAA